MAKTKYSAVGSSYFPDGMDSGTLPNQLGPTQYSAAMNVVNRGGILQTRPGFTTLFGMPCKQPQGIKFFKPTNSPACIVIAVDGYIYYSVWNNGFKNYQLLPNVHFSPNFTNIYWSVTSKFSDRDSLGNVYYLDQPINVLIMQDGVSRAAYWDGQNSGHLNPTPSDHNSTISPAGYDGTPIGEWMAWAGNRLWVSRGNQLFPSDYGNPMKFKEGQYLANAPSLYLPEPITGMIQPTINSPLYVFGATTKTEIDAANQIRETWTTDPAFQNTDFTIGCIAGRSIVLINGLMWWYSAQGVTNLNAAAQTRISSVFSYQDSQMAYSKIAMPNNKTAICALPFENYLLFSVPSGDRWNNHTWCLDLLTVSNGNKAWSSFWTGIRPVEWTSGIIGGQQFSWCLSRDRDGVNRVWQAFDGSRTDNGCPITCWVQTGAFNNGNLNHKRFGFADSSLEQILGDLDISIFFASERGAWQRLMTKRIVATPGIFGTVPRLTNNTLIQSYKPQTRYVRTEDNNDKTSDCNLCGVESDRRNYEGLEYQLLFVWSGRGAIKNFRMFITDTGEFDTFTGACEKDEVGPRVLTELGCSSLTTTCDNTPFMAYSDADTVTLYCPTGQTGYPSIGMAVRSSIISEKDANKRATCAAYQDARSFLNCSTN